MVAQLSEALVASFINICNELRGHVEMTDAKTDKSQTEKFKRTARVLGCDEDETAGKPLNVRMPG